MEKFTEFLENKLSPIAGKFATQRHLTALRDGIVTAMPLIIIGSFFLVLANLPIPGYTDFLENFWQLDLWFNKIVDATFGIMGLVASFSIAYYLAQYYKVDGIAAGIISLSSFILVTPTVESTENGVGIAMLYMGSRGLFVAIIVGLITTEIYKEFIKRNIQIKLPESVPPAVNRSFAALIPGFTIILLFAILYKLLSFTNVPNIHDLLLVLFEKPLFFLGGTLLGTLIAVGLNSLFWFTGLHGGNIVGSVMGPIWLMNTDANRLAFQAGEELPHIITAPFADCFVYIGGGGATFALVFLLFFFSKSEQGKAIGKLSFFPDIFNVNEPAMFGIPIVMNPILIIPFILAPMVNTVIAYFAMYYGIVEKTVGIAVPWTTPPIISGYLATGGSISGALLQCLLIGINILIYLFFFKTLDKQHLENEKM